MGFNITLQPGNHTFIAEAGETILEAAGKHGHKLPHGCGDGACGMCKGNVLQGEVDHGNRLARLLRCSDVRHPPSVARSRVTVVKNATARVKQNKQPGIAHFGLRPVN